MKSRLIPALLAAAQIAAAGTAFAEDTLGASGFDAYTRGKTLIFSLDGEAYGAERYLEDRRVIWSFLDGECKNGLWYEDNGLICFVYEDRPEPQCWAFRQGNGGLVARFSDDLDGLELYEAQDTGEDMVCLGPKVGV